MTATQLQRDARQEPRWPAIDTLIPHRPPMLLVQRIVAKEDDVLVCRGVLPGRSPTLEPATASPFLALELAAQTAAVLAALEGGETSSSGAAIGYLTSIRDARFLVPEIPAGRRLLATVRAAGRMPPLVMYAVTVALEEGSVELLTATLSTYLRA